jgi:uncharacterized membrane protein YoaK (UPF0700 family)
VNRSGNEVAGPTPPSPAEERTLVAGLLSMAGGFLDAFTWVAHGGVFANAQTGNVVLLGVFAALGRWSEALRHIPPILAFVLGVFLAHRLRPRAARLSLIIEIALLLVVAVLPRRFPDLPIVLGVAFVAALQSSSFPRVRGLAYNSVMTTGNLRRAAEALFTGVIAPGSPVALSEAWIFIMICGTFALGAAVGAFCTVRLGNTAVAAPMGLLVVALALCAGRERRKAAPAAGVAPD